MIQAFELISQILSAIPVVKGWVESFMAWYVEQKIASMKQENRDAIKRAVDAQDQRDIEKLLGSSKVGEPTELPGTEIRTELPGVKL